MIKGVHAMFYSPQADELRAFLRDKLELPFFDAGEGWLIFTPAEGEIGCHPDTSVRQEISLYCDDIEKTVEELTAKGVTFTGPVEDHSYGLVTFVVAPGDLKAQIYQPRYK